uniref:RRM domain-containing protein n=1 Tax=Brassica oleracea var. oleracea TaxID=109376 RepID=A0A0D3AB73_BRAOL
MERNGEFMGITILFLDELETSTVTAGSGRALGFGFIVFANPSVAERMVMEKHIIDGRRLHRSRYPSGATEVFLQTGEQSGGSNQAPFWMSKLENQQQLLATPLMGGLDVQAGEPTATSSYTVDGGFGCPSWRTNSNF